MYPVGITSIADRLERAGYHVQVINVAYRMLRDARYDPEAHIRKLRPRLWAIDLHWLPHVHGAMALAELIKKHHPDGLVLMGGLSASYYHEEMIQNPHIDFIIRGDSAEEPVVQLISSLRHGRSLESVPNLTWRDAAGKAVINPLSHVPASLDATNVPAYRYIMRSVYKYANLQNIVPYLRWLEYPMTALLTARGCTQGCSICGGSRASYKQICNRDRPAFRSPEKLAEDVRFITRFSRAPIFVIHDIRMYGMVYVRRLLDLLRQMKVQNELVLELFAPADDRFFRDLHQAIPRYSLELTLESHDPELRRLNGKFPYDNEAVESTIAAAMANGCNRLDIFFMVGIPHQTRESAMAAMAYARRLLEQFGRDGRLQLYVAPLAPFLDPGSPAFEEPERYGYRLRARTLEEHRQRLTLPTWSQILNYESLSLPPDQLVQTTYDASAELVRIKRDLNLMEAQEADETLALLEQASSLFGRMEQADRLPEPERSAQIAQLQAEAQQVNRSRVYRQTDFVSWGRRRLQLNIPGLIWLMAELFFEELGLAWLRLSHKRYAWQPARSRKAKAADVETTD